MVEAANPALLALAHSPYRTVAALAAALQRAVGQYMDRTGVKSAAPYDLDEDLRALADQATMARPHPLLASTFPDSGTLFKMDGGAIKVEMQDSSADWEMYYLVPRDSDLDYVYYNIHSKDRHSVEFAPLLTEEETSSGTTQFKRTVQIMGGPEGSLVYQRSRDGSLGLRAPSSGVDGYIKRADRKSVV